jgi:NAD(P)-dependent dehydrogenase (short-subunit alcohol dehydrogenase family)
MRFDGHVVLVTGAAKGIGLRIGRALPSPKVGAIRNCARPHPRSAEPLFEVGRFADTEAQPPFL